MPGDLLGLGHDEDGLVVAGGQRLPGTAILARRHREVAVRVGGPAVGLHQLVDDDVGRTPAITQIAVDVVGSDGICGRYFLPGHGGRGGLDEETQHRAQCH